MTDDNSQPPKLLIIAGPTGVGKSSFALQLAKRIKGEIVSVDSVQVYKGLHIGSAKPSLREQAEVPHHLIDWVDPHQEYNAADFMADARQIIENIRARNAVPIVVGGTNLYIRILTYGVFEAPPASPIIRQRHQEFADKFGRSKLHEKLLLCDPKSAERIHPNDLVRVSRALEVFELTHRTLSSWHDEHQFKDAHYNALLIAFNRPRHELYRRINTRVDDMIQQGLYQEWLSLVHNGVDPDCPAMTSLGYRHMKLYHQCNTENEKLEVVELMKRDTRRFAKQQLSWLRNDPRTIWFTLPEDLQTAFKKAYDFLEVSPTPT